MLQDRKPKFQDASDLMSAADESAEAPALGASRVGAELRMARQRLGWALPDVAQRMRIRLPYLEAIEEGRLADLPGNAYAMGFLRSYSTFLGLDAAEVARRFRAEAHEVNRKPELMFPAPVPQRGVPAGAVVLLGVLIAAGAYTAWYKFSGDNARPAQIIPAVPERLAPLADRAAPPSNLSPQVASVMPPANSVNGSLPPVAVPPPPVPVPVPVPVTTSVAPPAPPPPIETNRVVLRMKASGYVQVREKQGPVLLNRVMRAGETWPAPKGPILLLTTGNPAGMEIVLDGVAATLPGTSGSGAAGAPRRDIQIDPDPAKGAPAIVRPPPPPAQAATPAAPATPE